MANNVHFNQGAHAGLTGTVCSTPSEGSMTVGNGSLLIVAIASYEAITISSVADDLAGSYALIASKAGSGDSANFRLFIYGKYVATGGSNVVDVTVGASAAFDVAVYELHGTTAQADYADGHNEASGDSGTGTTTVTTTYAESQVFGVIARSSGEWTAGTDCTEDYENAINMQIQLVRRTTPPTSAGDYAVTGTGASNLWLIVGFGIKGDSYTGAAASSVPSIMQSYRRRRQ